MGWVKKWHFKEIALIVAFAIFVIGSVPSRSMAFIVGSHAVSTASIDRAADMDVVQRVLEARLVSARLESFGLSKAEVKDRINRLSDSELHGLASQLDSLYPGSGFLGVIVTLLIIAILALVLLKMADRKIIIR